MNGDKLRGDAQKGEYNGARILALVAQVGHHTEAPHLPCFHCKPLTEAFKKYRENMHTTAVTPKGLKVELKAPTVRSLTGGDSRAIGKAFNDGIWALRPAEFCVKIYLPSAPWPAVSGEIEQQARFHGLLASAGRRTSATVAHSTPATSVRGPTWWRRAHPAHP